MDWLRRRRYFQVIEYGWTDAKKVSKETGRSQLKEYLSIITCFKKYYVFSNQYIQNRLWAMSEDEKRKKAEAIGKKNQTRDDWAIDSYNNRKFIAKWSLLKWEKTARRKRKRKAAYTKQFNAGKGLMVQRNVDIHREHGLNGTIKIGNDVLLAKHVFIDYSGDVVLSDNVKLSAGAIIESHRHAFVPGSHKYEAIPTCIVIEEGVWIGQRAVICESSKRVGRFAQIGAGAFVRNPVPPYAIMVGNPAKIVGFLFTPEEVEQFEKEHFPLEERTDIKKYETVYNKFFINRIEEIKQLLKN